MVPPAGVCAQPARSHSQRIIYRQFVTSRVVHGKAKGDLPRSYATRQTVDETEQNDAPTVTHLPAVYSSPNASINANLNHHINHVR